MNGEVIVLNIPFSDKDSIINPVLLHDDKNLILVDCGSIYHYKYIKNEIEKHGFTLDQLTGIILTHHDFDHLGDTAVLKTMYPHIKIYSSKEEEPYISGKKEALRITQAKEIKNSLSEKERAEGEYLCAVIRNVINTEVDVIVKDGDFFDWCGGCRIIGTEGHTPGHISLYLNEYKTVITGDAAIVLDDTLKIPVPQFAYNLEQAEKSFQKLLDCSAETFICYHGGVIKV